MVTITPGAEEKIKELVHEEEEGRRWIADLRQRRRVQRLSIRDVI